MKFTSFFITEQGASIEGDVLRNVVVLGPVSKNGRRYSDKAMQGAVKLYEGASVYVDHPLKEQKARKVEERFGHLANVRFVEGEHRVRGDVHFLGSHPAVSRIKEAVGKGNPYFGLSPIHDGKGIKRDGTTYVESIDKVYSVDLVDGAATGTLTEQEEGMPADPAAAQAGNPEGFGQALVALLATPGLSKEVFLEKADALWDTLMGAPAEGQAPATEQDMPAWAKAMKEQLDTLTGQAAPGKDKKYTKPTSVDVHAAEQTGAAPGIPTDKKALGRWLHKAV